MNYKEISILKHKEYNGKLEVNSKVPLDTLADLATYYSPGVAAPCLEIKRDNSLAYDLTWKKNTIAVVSDGSAVLGLGNIGALASLPVMEGKSILFKKFAGVDAVPIVIETQDSDEIINIVKNIAPSFGGINLEDIKAPECFYIEEQLKEKLNIPVFHDDQHGTAIVVLAGLINSLKVTGRKIEKTKIVVVGAGAAAIACVKLLALYGFKNIVVFDSKGVIYSGREGLNKYKEEIVKYNIENFKGTLREAMNGRDVFIGFSGQKNIISRNDIKKMNSKSIIFALSNPEPEIMPEEAIEGGAFIISTGRSDYPNQINNVLAFPGIFKGILEGRIEKIEDTHKIKAAEAIANLVVEPRKDKIIPGVFEEGIAESVANAIKSV